jgi:chromosome segregation ATPase
MPDEIRISVNAKITKSLHDSILAAVEEGRYKDKTACITEAIDKLLCNTQEEIQDNTDILREKESEIQNLQSVLQTKYTEIQELKSVIQSKDAELQNYKSVLQNNENEIRRLQSVIQEAPDPLELAEMKGLYTGTQKVVDEKDKRIEALEREVSRLDMFAHYFKNVETKQIEAPAAAKVKHWWKFW